MARKKRRLRQTEQQPKGVEDVVSSQSYSASPSSIAAERKDTRCTLDWWYSAIEQISTTIAMLAERDYARTKATLAGFPLTNGIVYVFTDKEMGILNISTKGTTSGGLFAEPITGDPRTAVDSALERETTIGFASLSLVVNRYLQSTGTFSSAIGRNMLPLYKRGDRNYFVF